MQRPSRPTRPVKPGLPARPPRPGQNQSRRGGRSRPPVDSASRPGNPAGRQSRQISNPTIPSVQTGNFENVYLGQNLLEQMEIIVEGRLLEKETQSSFPLYVILGNTVDAADYTFVATSTKGNKDSLTDVCRNTVKQSLDDAEFAIEVLGVILVKNTGPAWVSPSEAAQLAAALTQKSDKRLPRSLFIGVHASSPSIGEQESEYPWHIDSHICRFSSSSQTHQIGIYDLQGNPFPLEL